jgi:type I restriction enzyme S subunit
MPSESAHALVPLSDAVLLQRGFDLPAHTREPGKIPVVASTGVVGHHAEAKAEAPGVVIGRSGSIGGGQYLSVPFWPLNTTLWVKDFRGNHPRYIYYLLRSIDFSHLNAGSGVPTLNRNHLTGTLVWLPAEGEQRRIANVLGALDDKVDSNRRLASVLEANAAALYRARFVEFLGESEFRETGNGRIPKDWVVAPVGEVLTVVGGATPSTKEPRYWHDGTHCWATPKDLAGADSRILLETKRHITDAGVGRISSGMLPRRTVLLSSRAPIGYTALSAVEVAVNQGFIAIPPVSGIPSEFVLCWVHENLDRIKAYAGGTTFAEISKRAFRPLPMLVPPAAALANFEETVRPMFDLLVGQEMETQTLLLLRDTLLPRLISGQIRVRDTADPEEILGPLIAQIGAGT